jgi:enamine deaminase RidA (YjgF/YER057c/UK114 family)
MVASAREGGGHSNEYRHVCAARDEILKVEQPPVSTAVGVPELARPGTLVEIEAIAVLWRSEYG